jgi:hypothetical protein
MGERRYSTWQKFPGLEAGESKTYFQTLTYSQMELTYAKSNAWTWVDGGFITYYDALEQQYTSDYCMYRGVKGNPPNYCFGHNDPDLTPWQSQPRHSSPR